LSREYEFLILAGVGLNRARFVRDGHNFGHKMPYEKGLWERLKHPMSFYSFKGAYTPIPALSKIATYCVTICSNRGLYCKYRNPPSSKNAGVLTIFSFSMSLYLLFAVT